MNPPPLSASLSEKKRLQQLRRTLYRAVEDFLTEHGFTGVEVPSFSDYLIPEPTIAPFASRQTHPTAADRPLFLIPSSEVYLKPLLAAGWGNLFCLSHCYRNREQSGRLHNPEFSMLEYYASPADYLDLLSLTQALFAYLSTLFPGSPLSRPAEVLSVQEAFLRFAGIDLYRACRTGTLLSEARRAGIHPSDNESTETLFHWLMVAKIEEALPPDHPVVLMDFPSFVPTTAARCSHPFWCQRWELYAGGIELCNCYTERSSVAEMEDYMAAAQSPLTPADTAYCRLFRTLPPCAGNAMGLDRLLMILTGTTSIDAALLFPEKSPLSP